MRVRGFSSSNQFPTITLITLVLTFIASVIVAGQERWISWFSIHRIYLFSLKGLYRSILSIFFTGKFSVGYVMSLFFNVKCLSGLELNTFTNQKADFVYMIFLGILGTILACAIIPHYFIIGISLEYMMLYYWARRNPFSKVSIYFIPLKSTYLPYAMLLLSFLTSAEIPWSGIIGVLLGHTYYFFRDVIPLVYKHRQLPVPHYTQAPRWFNYIFDKVKKE